MFNDVIPANFLAAEMLAVSTYRKGDMEAHQAALTACYEHITRVHRSDANMASLLDMALKAKLDKAANERQTETTTVPAATPAAPPTATSTVTVAPPEPLPETQRKILTLLAGKAMRGKELASELDCDLQSLTYNHLTPLKKSGRIRNERGIGGYFRPDAPPQ